MDATAVSLFAGRFRLDREVGHGASGIVFRATNTSTLEPVALKVLGAASASPEARARFTQEGRFLAEMAHDGIVRVLDYGTLDASVEAGGRRFDSGTPYVAMEWLEGEDLQARLGRGPLDARQALEIARQLAGALAAAHEAGVVHRDVKPSNVFLLGPADSSAPVSRAVPRAARARVKLVDFGVAVGGGVEFEHDMAGTPAYMAPEQARGDVADARSDVYSLGAVLFELLAGRPPHVGPSPIATLARLVTAPAPRLSELFVEVPDGVDDLVHAMLSFEPSDRPASARAVEERLTELLLDPALDELATGAARETELPQASATRLVTTVVALRVGTSEARAHELSRLVERGAEAMPLGADSLVVHLGARRAHGDEAVRAIEIAKHLCTLGARVGVATGRMQIDRVRSASSVVDRAASLAREATVGLVLADSTTVELTRASFRFRTHSIAADPRCGALEGRGGEVRNALPFVGRDAELAQMGNACMRSRLENAPVLVSVSGPPGIGKSRLAQELVDALEDSEHARVFSVRCASYARAQALGIAADSLRHLVGLPKSTGLAQAEEALRAHGLAGDDLLPRLLSDEPLPDGADQRSARDALYVSTTELVKREAERGPCVLLFEDAQWADPESIAWLDHLIGRAAGRPLVVVLIVRPAFWRDHGQRFSGRDHVRIELRPMALRATREIARAVIGAEATEEMLEQVAVQAAGSPLFAEELARLIASGKDAATAPTIEAAIEVTLDALDDQAREALIRGSVFGSTVWEAGLAALGVADTTVVLTRLIGAEFLVEHRASRFADTRELLFKHALVRDVVYASATEELRQKLHADAARWLATQGEDSATIAQHYDLGGLHPQAAEHWEAAARRALATSSLQDAVMMADRALVFSEDAGTTFSRAMLLDEAYSRLDARSSERDSAIRAMLDHVSDEASALRAMGARARYDDVLGAGIDVEARLTEVRDRARHLELSDEEARCSATLAHRYAFAGQLSLAEAEAANLIDLAHRRQIVWAAVDAWQTLAVVHQTRGELASALEARRSAARTARAAGLKQQEATLTINVGFALTTIGARQEALDEIEAGLSTAQAIGSAGAVRHGQMVLLGWAATFGADVALDGALAEPRACADEAAGSVWTVRDRGTLGILFYRGCELLRGDGPELLRARSLLEKAAKAYRATDNRDVLPVALGFWAEAERRFGDAEHAVKLAREAAELVESGAPSLLNEGPIYLALHDACVDLGDFRGARDAMERAMVPLLRRRSGLEGTAYARGFLRNLPANAGLLAAAEAYGCVPAELVRELGE